uniref:class I SAM-dependent methyltransferase n=1 Tax=uncultured Altererythrobacter sp. TaxID=500840 RepID=UPI0026190F8C|nr:class I SAM-dependent methyltransferase [uncultured Altererythrobacter sp.]
MTMTVPDTKAEERSARLWDRFAKGYAEKPIADMQSYHRKLSLSQQYFRPNMRLVEFGCGTGGTAITHARHVAHVTATDVSGKMLEFAKKNATEAGIENVTFSATSIESFEAPDGSFDAVLMLSLLHLLENPGAALDKAHRLLKPDGLLITSTACLGDSMRWFGMIAPVGAAMGLIPKVQMISEDELRGEIVDRGFACLEEFSQADNRTYFQIARKLA